MVNAQLWLPKVHYLGRTCCPIEQSMQGVIQRQSCMGGWCRPQQMKQNLSWLMTGSWLVKKVTTSCWNRGSRSHGKCCSSSSSRLTIFLKVSSLLSSCSSSLPIYTSSSSAAMHSSKVDTHVEAILHIAQISDYCHLSVMIRHYAASGTRCCHSL